MVDIGTCEHCNQRFPYRLIHNGFNDTAYAYCDTCGCTAFLSAYSPIPSGASPRFRDCIDAAVEPFLKPCVCGGRFRAGASPRCPHCRGVLSPELAATYLEANAPGTLKGWRWQRSWTGLYCIVVGDRKSENPWVEQSST